MATVHKITEIRGMDEDIAQKLLADGITTVEELLAASDTPAEKRALAAKLGVEGPQLTDWINRADLMRLKGVGRELAHLLEECGVDSCKELQHRVPANLYAKLKSVNDAEKITHHVPNVAEIEEWIKEAASFAAPAAS